MNNRNLIRFDWAIKRLLRNKADYFVLEGFLSELLKEDIAIQSILESESNQHIDSYKFNRVDLLVKNSKDELIIIEIEIKNDEKLRIARELKRNGVSVDLIIKSTGLKKDEIYQL